MTNEASPTASRRRWLYGPILGFLVLVVLYTAYWFFAIGKIEAGLDDWLAEQRAKGAEISYTSREFGGFPYRFAVSFKAPDYRNWRGRFEGEEVEIFLQPWNYKHAIARAPGRNRVSVTGFDGVLLLDEKSAASFRWDKSGLRAVGVTLNIADIISADGDVSLRGVRSQYTAAPDSDQVRLRAQWDRISVPDELLAGQSFEFLGPVIENGEIAAQFDGMADQSETSQRRFEVARMSFDWGPFSPGAKGMFEINSAGHIDGPLNVRLDRSEQLVDAIAHGGIGGPELLAIVQGVGAASADGKFLPLRVRNGETKFLGQTLFRLPPIAPPRLSSSPPQR